TDLMVDDLAISALRSDEEGRSFTAGGSCTVHTGPAHGDDSRACVDRLAQLGSVRQRCQVVAYEFGTCGQVITVGFLPIHGFEQCACGLIDVVLPRREETDVPPFENGCGRCGASFEHDGVDPSGHQVGGCGETGWPGPDDSDGQIGGGCALRHDRPP